MSHDEFDDMAEFTLYPYIYDEIDPDMLEEAWDDCEEYDDSMDGDFDSAMRDAGMGTDEDYDYYGEDY